MNTTYIRALNGEALTKHEIIEFLRTARPQEVYELAHKITRKFMGSSFDSCSIINAKSGNCPEDCKWCSQSAHNKAKIDIYPLISKEQAIKQATYNSSQGIKRFSLVTSGKRVSKKEIDQICDIVRSLPKTVIPCVSLGLIDKEDLQKLYDAGVTRYHCNIESSPDYFRKLCTTHTTEDKMKTLNAALQVGMSLCSGGIIGMGETMEDRIDMALFLRELNILSIPINVLHPIPGTKLENSTPLSNEEYLLSVSLFRIINPNAFLRFAGGRALLSKEIQKKALYIGINSAIMGDMLTTLGSGTQEDMEMFAAAHYLTHIKTAHCAKIPPEMDSEHVGAKPKTISDIESCIWHPYSSVTHPTPTFLVESAHGVKIKLEDGTELVDGMSSWWAAMHGYNHPALNKAATEQIAKMSHIMFGGFTHKPVQELTGLLLDILPKNGTEQVLTKFFYSDSGSISVEVALKMAIQYWATQGECCKNKFATVRNGYHGDTWNAMSVCDPVTGMHSLFGNSLPINFFAPAPKTKFGEHQLAKNDIEPVEEIFKEHSHEIAAFILEPVVQGTGGMRFYSPAYLVKLKELCLKYNILLIFDEIATGFGRTGKMFAIEHTADYTSDGSYIFPDIITIGKGLTGGYMTLAATICNTKVAETICNGNPGVFMHGPTFMGNPLACAIACASIKTLLSDYNHLEKIRHIENKLNELLSPAQDIASVADVRVLGAIGVVEMKEPVDLHEIQPLFVKHNIWLRPFGKLLYTMPPYIINDNDLATLCNGIITVIKEYK